MQTIRWIMIIKEAVMPTTEELLFLFKRCHSQNQKSVFVERSNCFRNRYCFDLKSLILYPSKSNKTSISKIIFIEFKLRNGSV